MEYAIVSQIYCSVRYTFLTNLVLFWTLDNDYENDREKLLLLEAISVMHCKLTMSAFPCRS